jgi:hypothetical protein
VSVVHDESFTVQPHSCAKTKEGAKITIQANFITRITGSLHVHGEKQTEKNEFAATRHVVASISVVLSLSITALV